MRRRHAILPGFSGHYPDLGILSRKRHDSACKLILSVVSVTRDKCMTLCPGPRTHLLVGRLEDTEQPDLKHHNAFPSRGFDAVRRV